MKIEDSIVTFSSGNIVSTSSICFGICVDEDKGRIVVADGGGCIPFDTWMVDKLMSVSDRAELAEYMIEQWLKVKRWKK